MSDDVTCRTFDDKGQPVCEEPARFIVWGHLYGKRDKGPKCARHLPPSHGIPWVVGGVTQAAIYAIPDPQPPTDAEVEAAARAMWAWEWSLPWDEYSAGRPPASGSVNDLRAVHLRRAKIALTAAREAVR